MEKSYVDWCNDLEIFPNSRDEVIYLSGALSVIYYLKCLPHYEDATNNKMIRLKHLEEVIEMLEQNKANINKIITKKIIDV